ncbi:glycosyl transferase family 1 [Haloprofundus marisrubri]|uniref:Glycosyl transferase family 1 n=1 Tax=Haloprofundus marisrubri TaxID=1514971 RepID=A0A0W1R7N7_9EURY|nr:glycosyltransferase family 4 protein [Haloprofundus marisrubri]KTG09028.1 glycosyl transferase family 1 [Haloprofundus marisrubri]
MRILRVAQKLYPEVKGGGPYHVHAMSRDQAAMGHDVTVLTVSDDIDNPHREDRDGYSVVRYPTTVSALGNDISGGVASFLQTAHSYDVIHAHSHLYFSTNLAALKRRSGDIPLAITNHGLYSQNAPEWLFDLYLRSVGQWTFNQADVVLCYTETDRQRVRSFNVNSRIEVVSNGIDTERFCPSGPKSSLIEDEVPVVLFVGRLVEGKQPRKVIESLALLREKCPDAELYICGSGPLQGELKELTERLELADAVHFLGYISYDEMPQVYRSGDVLLLPSRAEGLPRTVLEAMASGLPVVVSELEQMTDVVGDAGYFVDAEDSRSIAQALVSCLDHQDSNVIGTRARSRIVEQYHWPRTVEKTTDVLTSLVERNRYMQ